MILSAIVFIIVLALLVLVHEFGHFIAAKKSGMEVQEFGFGFPPRVWGFKKGETLYSINLLPLGGFVKIVGENNEEEHNPRSFINKSFWQRLITLAAGVLMNFVLAWVLISIGLGLGLPTVVEQGQQLPKHAQLTAPSIAVLEVAQGSPASQAGLKEGDNITSVDGNKFNSLEEVTGYVKGRAGNQVMVEVQRGKETLHLKLIPRVNPPAGEGAIGIALGYIGKLSYPWYITPYVGFTATVNIMKQTALGFYNLIASGEGASNLGGPVRIAALTGQVTKLGLPYLIQFTAFLSVNLGIINIVPFPALDGGRILFLFIEKIRGKRNNQMLERWTNTVGFALLLLLVLFISIRDVSFLIK